MAGQKVVEPQASNKKGCYNRGVLGSTGKIVGGALVGLTAMAAAAAEGPPPEARHLADIRVIPFDGAAGEGYFSPDGRTIIFQARRPGEGAYQIYTVPTEGGAPRRISGGVGKTTCSFFRPDGRKILYASTHHAQHTVIPPEPAGAKYRWDFDPEYEIYEANPDGSGLRRLTRNPGYDAEGSYSPDGRRITFTSDRDGDLEIYVMDGDGKHPRRLTRAKGYDGGPFFSPDGKWVVFRGFRNPEREQEAHLYLVSVETGREIRLTQGPAMDWAPYFHPDGGTIVFSSNRGDPKNFELYTIRTDGTGLTRITFDDGFDALPVFSPDGKRLLWTSTRGGGPPQLQIADYIP